MTPSARRTDLDWLRIIAFGLLIFYHVGLFYVPWTWHVNTDSPIVALEPLLMLLNPWRLMLLFLISGVATRFMFDKMKTGDFLKNRMNRLFWPLLFGVFVIVPPQVYYEMAEKLGYSGSGWDFYARYVTGDWEGTAARWAVTPSYNHLWFVAYLIAYTLLIVPLSAVLKRMSAFVAPMASPLALMIGPALYLIVANVWLKDFFQGGPRGLPIAWYAHFEYFAAFLFGYAIAKYDVFFDACLKYRKLAVGAAFASWGGLMAGGAAFYAAGQSLPEWAKAISHILHAIQAWGAIVALIGFAQIFLKKDGPVRRYLTDAIFAYYIVHQTVIVVAGYYIDQLTWPIWIEALLVISITLLACYASYEIARRVAWLRPLFGLKPKSAQDGDKPIEAQRAGAT
ncbi:MAG: acyltransferase family protein [Caulobacterales bacterium]